MNSKLNILRIFYQKKDYIILFDRSTCKVKALS